MQKIPLAKIDLYLFNAVNGFAKKSRTLDFFAIMCARYLGYLFLVLVLATALITHHWQLFLIPVFVGLCSRFIVAETVYLFYQRKRPLEVLSIHSLIEKPKHPAFPSGHASFFFAFSFALFLFHIPLAIAAVIMSCCVTLSRVFCGVHWPSDILAGALVSGVAFFILCQLL